MAQWRGDLLGGVVALTGRWADGTPMLAVPNYARMNRATGARRDIAGGSVDYAPGTTAAPVEDDEPAPDRGLQSQVWMKA